MIHWEMHLNSPDFVDGETEAGGKPRCPWDLLKLWVGAILAHIKL